MNGILKKLYVFICLGTLCAGIIAVATHNKDDARNLETTAEEEHLDIPYAGYFNDHPISVQIDDDFPANKAKQIKELLENIDENSIGIKFVFVEENAEQNPSHIIFHWDDEELYTGFGQGNTIPIGARPEALGCAVRYNHKIYDEDYGNIIGYEMGGDIYIYPDYWLWLATFDTLIEHETGHILRLEHVDDFGNIMYPEAVPFVRMQDEDFDKINELHPAEEEEQGR